MAGPGIGYSGNNSGEPRMSHVMTDPSARSLPPEPRTGPQLDGKPHAAGAVAFIVVLALGLLYAAFSIVGDVNGVGEHGIPTGTLVLLGLALLIALGFEFVNGFHDTANAVATVIYTNSAAGALVAVVWSGMWNFLGVLASTGAVAFGIVSLLPVELILQVGSAIGLRDGVRAADRGDHLEPGAPGAFGIPNSSSSHTLIGSIIGVGVANAAAERPPVRPPPAWTGDKATEIVLKALLLSAR